MACLHGQLDIQLVYQLANLKRVLSVARESRNQSISLVVPKLAYAEISLPRYCRKYNIFNYIATTITN